MSIYDKGVYQCTYCLNTYFCVDCFEIHRDDPLPCAFCDSDHEFVYTQGLPKDFPADKIKVGGKIRDREEWLDEIRKTWGLPPRPSDPVAVKSMSGVAAA